MTEPHSPSTSASILLITSSRQPTSTLGAVSDECIADSRPLYLDNLASALSSSACAAFRSFPLGAASSCKLQHQTAQAQKLPSLSLCQVCDPHLMYYLRWVHWRHSI